MAPLIPSSGSGSPCEATSNGPGLGEALCVLKRQIRVSLRCFRWEKLRRAPRQERNGGEEWRSRARRPSAGPEGEFEDHEDDAEQELLLENPERRRSGKVYEHMFRLVNKISDCR